MDARITKQRLGNLLSYDWLKMLAAAAAAVLLVVVIFIATATRAANYQKFIVYAYTDVSSGEDFGYLGRTLKEGGVLSYDVLDTGTEKFEANTRYDMFGLRRSTGEGTVMFISDVRVYKTDEQGNEVLDENRLRIVEKESVLHEFAMGGAVNPDRYTASVVYDSRYYLQMCEAYLVTFFGEDWQTAAEPDAEAVRESFFARNSGDKRYKTKASREAGVADERQRLLDLRDDFKEVLALFARGVYTHTVYEGEAEDGTRYDSALGINLGKLEGIGRLAYYTDDEGNHHTDKLNLVIIYNNYGEANGMLYEPITFLRWLYEEYGA